MTREQIAALIAEAQVLDKAATPGPWGFDADDEDNGAVTHQGAHIAGVGMADDFPCLSDEEYERAEMECLANRRFIARARTLIPELVAALQQRISE